MSDTGKEIIQERESSHGSWSEGAEVSQALKKILSQNKEKRGDSMNEALDRLCMKLSRIIVGDPTEPDHWKDLSGYSELVYTELSTVTDLTPPKNVSFPPSANFPFMPESVKLTSKAELKEKYENSNL